MPKPKCFPTWMYHGGTNDSKIVRTQEEFDNHYKDNWRNTPWEAKDLFRKMNENQHREAQAAVDEARRRALDEVEHIKEYSPAAAAISRGIVDPTKVSSETVPELFEGK